MLVGSAVSGTAIVLVALITSRNTSVQRQTPDDLRGRVSAAELIVGQPGPHIGNLRGLIADASSSTAALLSGGLLCLVVVVLIGASTAELTPPHITIPVPASTPAQ